MQKQSRNFTLSAAVCFFEAILPDISKTAMSCDENFQGDLWYDILESFAVQKIKNEQQMSIQQ